MFRKIPIRCARNRYFEMWESRLAKVLLLFDKLWNTRLPDGAIFTNENSALCWPSLLKRLYTTKLLQTLHFYSLFICILTLPRLKVLLVHTFGHRIKGQWYISGIFPSKSFLNLLKDPSLHWKISNNDYMPDLKAPNKDQLLFFWKERYKTFKWYSLFGLK